MQVDSGNAGGAGNGQGSGGAASGGGNDGGSGGGQSAGNGSDSNGQSAMVPKKDLERALGDLHRFKDQARSQASQITELQSQIESLKTKQAADANDYKALYESEKAKSAETVQKYTDLLGHTVKTERHRAAYPALKKAGLRDDAESLIDVMDMSPMHVEATSSGRFSVDGVEDWVEAQKLKFPYAFQKPNGPNVNGSTGNGGHQGGPVRHTAASLYALEQECRKKGDMAPWRAAIAEMQRQKQSQAR